MSQKNGFNNGHSKIKYPVQYTKHLENIEEGTGNLKMCTQ